MIKKHNERQRKLAHAYLAQSLVFQELQDEFGGTVRREVPLSTVQNTTVQAAGIVQTDRHSTIVEVKLANSLPRAKIQLGLATKMMEAFSKDFSQEEMTDVTLLVALVYDGNKEGVPGLKALVKEGMATAPGGIMIRLFFYDQLLEKYGFLAEGSD